MKITRTQLLIDVLLCSSILWFPACQQSHPIRHEGKADSQEVKRVKIKFLTDEAIKPFVGKTVGELLDSIAIKQEKHLYFHEPPGLWAGCCYFFSNEQALEIFVDDFQYSDQRDKKTVPKDEAFSKEIITGYRIFQWEH